MELTPNILTTICGNPIFHSEGKMPDEYSHIYRFSLPLERSELDITLYMCDEGTFIEINEEYVCYSLEDFHDFIFLFKKLDDFKPIEI